MVHNDRNIDMKYKEYDSINKRNKLLGQFGKNETILGDKYGRMTFF